MAVSTFDAGFVGPPTGVLLLNLGTPDAPQTAPVRRYLREFLLDPRVIDIPALWRWLLVNLIIVLFRAPKSAAAYRKIWLPEGSPLLVYGDALRRAVAAELGSAYVVALGMRYGNPSIATALEALVAAQVARIVVLPLFPQYSSAATGSAVQRALEEVAGRLVVPPLTVVGDFYAAPGFVSAFADVIRDSLADFDTEYLLFSYHGLPERHVLRTDGPQVQCDRRGPCPPVADGNRYCYRAQCYATTRAVAEALELAPDKYGVSFQSRLGRTPWIGPYTDHVLSELAARGLKRLAVCCPAFVADCLETLEEIGLRGREQWRSLGGESFRLVPSLNAHPAWVRAVSAMVRRAAPRELQQG